MKPVPAPIVLISAAMAVPSRFYQPVVDAFAEHQWPARALPTRGFEPGQPSASRGHDWGYHDLIADLAQAVADARREDPQRPVMLLGHSLGAQVAVGHELHRTPCDRFVAIGPSIPHYVNYSRHGVPLLAAGLGTPLIASVCGYVPKPFFGGPGPRTLMREWAAFVRTGRPPFSVNRSRVSTPSLIIDLQDDHYAPLAATTAFAEAFFEKSRTTRWTYAKDHAPQAASTHHIRWARQPAAIIDKIVDWYRQLASAH